MLNDFKPSGKALPCPICGRVKDGDCRILSDGRVFCHTKRDGKLGKSSIDNPAYVYLGESLEGQGSGMWKLDAPSMKAPRAEGTRYFDYCFWDGSPCPVQRFRKDMAEGKQVAWCKGGLDGRPQKDVAPYLWEKIGSAKQLFVVRGELKAELLCGKGFTAISLLNQKDEVLVGELVAMRANGVEIVLVPDCDTADLDKWFRYLSSEVPGVKQLLAPGLPWSNPPADGGLGIEDWIYQSSPSNDEIAGAISSIEADGLSSNEKNLAALEQKIQAIVDKHEDPLKRSALIKKEAAELGFNLTIAEVNSFISEAAWKEPVLYGGDILIPIDSQQELWGGLILYQSTNLLVAAPKVGKTSIITHIIGCIISRKSHCLNQPIHNYCDNFIVLGNDMARAQWSRLILKEGLGVELPNGEISAPNIKLACKGVDLNLSSHGIKYIVGLCKAKPNSMLVLDCLRAYSDGDEITQDFIKPIKALMDAIIKADCKTTIICIHHATKSGGATAIKAASGHGSITSPFDQTLNMNWLNPAKDEILQKDKRILITSLGRTEDQMIIVEQTAPFGKWIHHENADGILKEEAMFRAREALSPSRTKVLDQCLTIYMNTGQGLQNRAVMELLQCSRQVAGHHLEMLLKSNLLIRTGQAHTGFTYYPHDAERTEEGSSSAYTSTSADLGGRSDPKGAIDPPSRSADLGTPPSITPASFGFSSKSADLGGRSDPKGAIDPPCNLPDSSLLPPNPDLSPSESLGITSARRVQEGARRVQWPPDPLVSLGASRVHGVLSISSSSSCFIPEEEPPKDHSFLAGSSSNAPVICVETANETETLKPQLEQAVQVFRQGKWESGWTICDSRNPHSLRVRRERDTRVEQLANKRWGIDVQAEPLELSTSPSKETLEAVALDTSFEDLGGASRALEMPPTAAEEEEFF